MKKFIYILLTFALFALTACGSTPVREKTGGVVVTTFPEYEWAKNVIGEVDIPVTLLYSSGTDLHNFQPSVADMASIIDSQLFIFNGGESDEWVEDAISEETNALNIMSSIEDRLKLEETIEGMEPEREEEGEEEEEEENDEHIWLSITNRQRATKSIAKALSEAYPEYADTFEANSQAYCAQLSELDAQFSQRIENAKGDTLLFADRFPFRYLVDDYGIGYYAAFPGCSTESNASFETIVFLADKVDSLELDNVVILENSDGKVAQAVVSNSHRQDVQVLALDSMQTTTMRDVQAGKTYIDTMKSNLEIIIKALG